MRSWRTTIIGFLGILIVLITLLLVILDKATLQEVSIIWGGLSPLLVFLLGIFSKDAKATHSGNLAPQFKELKDEINTHIANNNSTDRQN